jgi:hypothetical protein
MRVLAFFLAFGAADIIAKEIGRWGIVGAFKTRWPSLLVAALLSAASVLLIPWVALLAGIAFVPAFLVYRARHLGTWNVFGVDISKVSRVGDLLTALRKGSLGTRLWIAGGKAPSEDPLGELGIFLTRDPDWRIRRIAAEVIGEWETPRSVTFLRQGLQDAHWRVQLECVRRLIGATQSWAYDVAAAPLEIADVLQKFLSTTAAHHPRVRRRATEGVQHLRVDASRRMNR